MERHLEVADVQISGFQAIIDMNLGGRGLLVMRCVLAAMSQFPGDAAVQTRGCNAIEALARDPDTGVAIMSLGGDDCVLRAMRVGRNWQTQESGCLALCKLAKCGDKDWAEAGKDRGLSAVDVVYDAMARSSSCDSVLRAGCKALGRLSKDTARFLPYAAKLKLLKFQINMERMCKTLAKFAEISEEDRLAVASFGGVQLSREVMRATAKFGSQAAGCKLLAALARGEEGGGSVAPSLGLVYRGLDKHAHSEDVQACGCKALAALSTSATGKAALRATGRRVTQVLDRALDSCGHCPKVCQYVGQVMENLRDEGVNLSGAQ